MMFEKKRAMSLKAVATLAVGSLVLAACSGGGDESSSGDGNQTLRIGLSADVPDLKPALDQGAAAMMLDTLLHRGLLSYDAEGEVVPALAESYEMIDSSTYSFELRDDLVFADGSDLTSEDVKASLEYLADEANGAKIYSAMSTLESIETPDDQTVIINLSSPNTALPEYLADTTAAILPEEAFEADGTSWEGAGPFVLEDTNKGVSFTLAKNPNYYDADSVKLEEIELTIYADGAARTNALLAGDVDLIDFLPWEDTERVKSEEGFTVDATSGPFMYIHFNVTDGPMADERVRQAIALAVNREDVASAAFSGEATTIAGAPIDPSSPYYNEELANGWETDVDRAKELLAEAGYADGFSATLLTSSQYAFHQDTALSIQGDLQEIGIDVTLDAPDWATRQQTALEGEYDMAIGGSAGVVNDPSFLANFVSGPVANNRSFGFNDDELNGLLVEGLSAESEEARIEAYDKVQERILETVPFASLVGRSQAFAYRNEVEGFSNIPGFLTFNSGYTLAQTSINE